ncbi:hypothetical protein AMJ48_00895 [Parcubacteria bacterium DG_74_1]|nr:MAG: hypothetical protein AMJ48_00895 [Parcubacteria bacterium DG_74_1]
MTKEINKKLIPIAIIVAGVLIAGAVVFVNQGKSAPTEAQPGTLSAEEAGEKAINFINKNLLPEGMIASLVNIIEESGMYKIQLKIEDEEFPSYITKDGKLLFPEEGVNLDSSLTQEVMKSDRPDVKLFVMSYCPYGLQAQKMFLPVYDLLKDKADMGIYFVNYIMHEKEEIDENLRQYCIQKEEKEKYYSYLNCFVKNGNFEECLNGADIDKNKMDSCISQTDETYKVTELYNDKSTWLNGYYPKFDVQKDLNDKYGVGGSPTIVINDSVIVQNQQYCPEGDIKCTVIPDFERTPEKFKEVICQTFNAPPSECSQNLSEESFSPGFGLDIGSSSEGSCE